MEEVRQALSDSLEFIGAMQISLSIYLSNPRIEDGWKTERSIGRLVVATRRERGFAQRHC